MKEVSVSVSQNVPALIDMLSELSEKEIALAVPTGSRIFHGIVGLKLLKREIDVLKKHVVIITNDALGESLARRAGFTVEKKSFVPVASDVVEIKKAVKKSAPEKPAKAPKRRYYIDEEIRIPIQIHDGVPSPSRSDTPDQHMPLPGEIVPDTYGEEEEVEFNNTLPPAMPSENLEPERSSGAGFQESGMSDDYTIQHGNKFFEKAGEMPAKPRRKLLTTILLVFTALACIAAAYTAYTILPRATVVVFPITEPVAFNATVIADSSATEINFESSVIPAEIIEESTTIKKDFAATGQREVNEKAHGTISIYNEYSSAPQTLIEKTRFLSKEGKLFRTTRAVIVPGAKIEDGKVIPSSTTVEVLADEAGDGYNIGPSEFTIPAFEGTPKYEKFYARSTEPMGAGAQGNVKIVTADDRKKAEEETRKGAEEEMKRIMQEKSQIGLKLLENFQDITIDNVSFSHEVDGIGDAFSVSVAVRGRAILFDEAHLGEFVESAIRSQTTEGTEINDETRTVTYLDTQYDSENKKATLSLRVEAVSIHQVDEAFLKETISGKNPTEVQIAIKDVRGIEGAEISLWPFWVHSVPNDIKKIKIVIEAKGSSS